ncbi:T9SS C-terminal target domain-containing protein [uncultured Parabacteroides sp.]|jgi:hypothetical protein|uniref:T9SS C-terminal target domain-containing protein n=1 Tax=uncultured Parabacteroides sp. TaxID=512312 RepID=UPI00260048DA|nr:T9SS C-terminal target domain-containing protein [uncultured Parabacteroides sp.]
MKEKHLRMFRRIFAGTAILAILVPVRAQVSNPSTWSDFVKGSGNVLVLDTFRMQTFSGSDIDNWNYKAENGTVAQEKEKVLKIPLNGKVSFEPYSLFNYQKVSAVLEYSPFLLVEGETLSVIFDNQNWKDKSSVIYPLSKSIKSVEFGSNPYRLDFFASLPSSDTQNGYFLFDRIYAYGQIPKYSFFSGSGNWNDTIFWSHLPPLRHRNALISGMATINSAVKCQTASLGDGGSLRIAKNGRFIVDTLFLHSTGNLLTSTDIPLTTSDFSLAVQGELSVKENITLQYTFPEKGKWYFLSFPFDVYQKGIDNRFQLKDEHFVGSGNYLYVQTYNGDKRASTQKPSGNWEVFSLSASSGNPLVFEKGKGYLVALDAAASNNTLTFSVEAKKLPIGFGKIASIPINIVSSADVNNDNSGWYLCGNPLLAPLKLSQIESTSSIDGNIYVYDGKNYTPYAIGSDYALPPLAAFFVKATSDTELIIAGESTATNAILLKSGFPLYSELLEPIDVKTQLAQVNKKTGGSILKGNALYLNDLPSAGKLKVIDVAGRLVYSCPVPYGSSVQSLPLRPGLYILLIDAGGYRTQHKCVLTQ